LWGGYSYLTETNQKENGTGRKYYWQGSWGIHCGDIIGLNWLRIGCKKGSNILVMNLIPAGNQTSSILPVAHPANM
jgi:hypothetical protein